MDYYDAILAGVPTSLAGVGGLLHATGLDLTFSLPAGALAAAIFILHGLFVNPPSDPAYGPHQ